MPIRKTLWSTLIPLAAVVALNCSILADFAETFKKANAGDAAAMTDAGYACETGNGTDKDLAKAVTWYRKASDRNFAIGRTNLGLCYFYGRGVAVDRDKGLALMMQAGEMGHAYAFFCLGSIYADEKDPLANEAEATKWYLRGVEAQDPQSMACLGWRYENGRGVPKDLAKAVGLYEKGARLGNAACLNALGFDYQNGSGVAADPVRAFAFYLRAAHAGDANAMYNVACCYRDGTGTSIISHARATKWFTRAMEAGQPNAARELRSLTLEDAKAGDGDAMTRLADMYAKGIGGPADNTASLDWTIKSVDALLKDMGDEVRDSSPSSPVVVPTR